MQHALLLELDMYGSLSNIVSSGPHLVSTEYQQVKKICLNIYKQIVFEPVRSFDLILAAKMIREPD